ncbi:MAG TPA: galactose-1-epimerase, partial [Ignavibacteriales bacterium]|nr:galactose-1-epimerase [Ignavibacteriales bacterium]
MISKSLFGKFADGRESFLYSIVNKNGMRANIIDYGAIVQSLYVKDKSGNLSDVVLGYDTLEGYVNDGFYIGAIVGRYGNRIAGGKFKLNGAEYSVTKNDGSNHLHGGKEGFSKKLWQAESISENSLKLTYVSKDREEGYPGTLILSVIYNVNDNNSLEINYEAKTDKPTILNPTHHS